MSEQKRQIGRFTPITMAEVEERSGALRMDEGFRSALTELFNSMQTREPYEIALEPTEKFVTMKARIMRFMKAKNIRDIQIRRGRKGAKDTIVLWKEKTARKSRRKQDTAPPQAIPQAIIASDTTPQENPEG